MSKQGIVIAFSGAMGSGTGAISRCVADRLGWMHVRFSDYIRQYAREQGDDPSDRGVLQSLGQRLVRDHLERFVAAVLRLANWGPGQNAILDGLRHAEVHVELRRQLGHSAELHVVHVDLSNDMRAIRSKAFEGLDAVDFARYAGDLTEAQLERVLPAYAELVLDGADPIEKLVDLVLRRFGYPDRAPDDRGEDVSCMEPMHLGAGSKHRPDLSNLAAELLAESKEFTGALPPGLRRPLANLVRAMNCYYSNLIEGHDTHPIDIERALRRDYSDDPKKRDLQLEAKAHIAVQQWIDGGGLAGRAPASQAILCEVHARFCSELPPSLLWVINPDTNERWRLTPGRYRDQDVKVGVHIAPSPGALPRFMRRFEAAYNRLGKLDAILATAAAHHRLLWIHPFVDGNGRVARLMSHVMLLEVLNNHGLWSVARGLARSEADYKSHLRECDLPRRNDLDGRGQLSEEALASFTRFFLNCCLDQVRYMRGLMQPDALRARWGLWVTEQADLNRLPRAAARLLNLLLAESDVSRMEIEELLGLSSDQTDKMLAQLKSQGVIVTQDSEDRFALAFPVALAERLTPGLFP